jgi:hypothetical protein
MMVPDAVKLAISDVVRDRLSDSEITSINIESGEDSDGEPVLKITIVFESGPGQETPDGHKMVGLARHIRGRLAEINVGEFPLLSFVSVKDAAKMNLEAA